MFGCFMISNYNIKNVFGSTTYTGGCPSCVTGWPRPAPDRLSMKS